MNKFINFIFGWFSFLAGLIFIAIITIYRFSHSEMTETQLFLKLWHFILLAGACVISGGYWFSRR